MRGHHRATAGALLLATVALTGCGSGGGGGSTPQATLNADAYAGTWKGNWNNQTFGTTGTMQLDTTVNDAQKTITYVVTLTGNVLGATAPPPQTVSGTFNTTAITINTQSQAFGAVAFTFDANGHVSGSATGLPNPNISRVDVTGTASGNTMNLSYTITFSQAGGGGTAHGVVALTKQ